MGWWDTENQVQAEELPMSWHGSNRERSVGFWGCPNEAGLWQQRGFFQAEHLPVTYSSGGIKVDFRVERSQFFLKYGYALPCPLQWYWNDEEGLVVTRSIISEGFWQAWKWWEGAQWWYLEKRPELFADLDWWETDKFVPVRYEPEDNPYAAVLGGQAVIALLANSTQSNIGLEK